LNLSQRSQIEFTISAIDKMGHNLGLEREFFQILLNAGNDAFFLIQRGTQMSMGIPSGEGATKVDSA
jgi:hypothetical protein